MKHRVLLLAALLLLCTTLTLSAQQAVPAKPAPTKPAPAGVATDWHKIAIPPLPAFKPQQPKRIELANGMVIFLQEDHELPLISGTMRIRGGSQEEPAVKIGMVDIYGDVWRTGGTDKQTGDALDDFLEARAAKVETNGGGDSTSISFNCLKEDFNDVFGVFLDLLRNPAFREDKLDLEKKQWNSVIARRNDDSSSIARREARFLGYGPESPYARVAEYYTVSAITRDDLVEWHKVHTAPNNIILGISGDFDPVQMEALLRQTFESWEKGRQVVSIQTLPAPAKPGVYVVNKEDVNQSEIRVVGLGIRRDNPDYFAAEVMNEVFGGGFSSRLFSNLRTKKGLAYAVGGGLGATFDHPGLFVMVIGTKTETTLDAIKGLREEMENLQKTPPSDAELRRAKDSILNSFIFNFDSPEKVLHERMAYEFYHYPADFLERYRASVEKVTAEDVLRVARQYIHPEKQSTLVVGNAAEFEKTLSVLGPVSDVDIAIPTAPKGAAPAVATTAQGNPEGKALIAKFVDALGGADKLRPIKSYRQFVTLQQQTPQGAINVEVEDTRIPPDRSYTRVDMPFGPMLTVISPQVAYMSAGGQVRDMPATARNDAGESFKRDMLAVAMHADDPAYIFAATGAEKLDGKDVAGLDVAANGPRLHWLLDPQSGRLLQSSYDTVGPAGPVKRVLIFSEWKPFDGINLPTKISTMENGQLSRETTLKNFVANPPVDETVFTKLAPAPEPPAK